MFDRLHQEDKRRREQQAEQLAAQQQAELENCTFAPSLADSASFERLLTPRQNAADFVVKANIEHTFQPQINEYEVRNDAEGRMAQPVYERLAADAQRAKEKQRALEEHYANLRLEGVTFRPDLPESSRRMSSSIGAAKEVFERLQQQKSPAPAAVTTPSRHASFSSRSLVKPSEANETELSDLLRSQQQQSNGSGEAEKVYSRLTERAQKAAEKLRELRAKEKTPQSTPVKSPSRTSLSLAPAQQALVSRLSQPKRAGSADATGDNQITAMSSSRRTSCSSISKISTPSKLDEGQLPPPPPSQKPVDCADHVSLPTEKVLSDLPLPPSLGSQALPAPEVQEDAADPPRSGEVVGGPRPEASIAAGSQEEALEPSELLEVEELSRANPSLSFSSVLLIHRARLLSKK